MAIPIVWFFSAATEDRLLLFAGISIPATIALFFILAYGHVNPFYCFGECYERYSSDFLRISGCSRRVSSRLRDNVCMSAMMDGLTRFGRAVNTKLEKTHKIARAVFLTAFAGFNIFFIRACKAYIDRRYDVGDTEASYAMGALVAIVPHVCYIAFWIAEALLPPKVVAAIDAREQHFCGAASSGGGHARDAPRAGVLAPVDAPRNVGYDSVESRAESPSVQRHRRSSRWNTSILRGGQNHARHGLRHGDQEDPQAPLSVPRPAHDRQVEIETP